MRYSTDEFSGITSILKIDLKLFAIVMIIVFLGMITLFSVSSGDSSLMLKQGTVSYTHLTLPTKRIV